MLPFHRGFINIFCLMIATALKVSFKLAKYREAFLLYSTLLIVYLLIKIENQLNQG